MAEKWSFGFRKYPQSNGVSFPIAVAEPILLAQLEDPSANHQRARLELIRVYRLMARPSDALAIATEYLAQTSDVEARAEVYFHLGQAMERVQDWESAIRWYTQAMELRPRSTFYWYLIHNNIGFSLNQQGRFVDAEDYLRKAILIDAHRANAFKNLGLSFEGQGRLADAARSYVASIRADAGDPRALRHLEELVERHAEVLAAVPDLESQIGKCREAVVIAARMRAMPRSDSDRE